MTSGPLFAGAYDLGIRPDFALVGAPWPAGGVQLLASKTLSAAELSYRAKYADAEIFGEDPELVWREISTVIRMTDFVLIVAPDYGAAFAALFAQWSPEPAPVRALPSAPAALPAP